MVNLLVASDSVVFRAFVRDSLEEVLGSEARVQLCASERIFADRLQQQARVDAVILHPEGELDGGAILALLGSLAALPQPPPVVMLRAPLASAADRALREAELPNVPSLRVRTVECPTPANATAGDKRAFQEALAAAFRGWGLALRGAPAPQGAGKETAAGKEQREQREHGREQAPSKEHVEFLALPSGGESPPVQRIDWPVADLRQLLPRVLVMGSSTGGPAALDAFFSALRGKPPTVPVVLVQHMPPEFTRQLAGRIGQVSGLPSLEGAQGMRVEPGMVIVAPGDFHMTLVRKGNDVCVALDKGPLVNSVRPAVDPLFETAAGLYGRHALGVVLTGMGEDGRAGALAMRAAGGAVFTQDAASCTVYGMPRAVFEAKACDAVGTPTELGALCARLLQPLVGRLGTGEV